MMKVDANAMHDVRTWEQQRRAEMQASFEAKAIADALRTIPERFQWATLTAPDLVRRVARATAVAKAAEVVAGRKSSTLMGGAGAGKTSLACAMFRALVEGDWRLARGSMVVAAYYLAKARAQFPLGQGEAEIVNRAIAAPVLVLDDLGAEPIRNSALAEVVYERHAECRPTIITTGFRHSELAATYGDGIARRMVDAVVINCAPPKVAGEVAK